MPSGEIVKKTSNEKGMKAGGAAGRHKHARVEEYALDIEERLENKVYPPAAVCILTSLVLVTSISGHIWPSRRGHTVVVKRTCAIRKMLGQV